MEQIEKLPNDEFDKNIKLITVDVIRCTQTYLKTKSLN